MTKAIKIRKCRYCGKELTEDDSPNRPQCKECSIKRLRRWYELQAEAKRKFDEEWS
jgi:DNA-directed RNA polymerase subunit RPC12/RpoP